MADNWGSIQFSSANGTNIQPLKGPPELKKAFIAGRSTRPYSKLSDISPLKEMKLTRLDCSFTEVANLAPLEKMPLTELHLKETKAINLGALKGKQLRVF